MPEKLGPRQPRDPGQAARNRRQVRVAARTQFPLYQRTIEAVVVARDWQTVQALRFDRAKRVEGSRAVRSRAAR
jgi:hypothetical protein